MKEERHDFISMISVLMLTLVSTTCTPTTSSRMVAITAKTASVGYITTLIVTPEEIAAQGGSGVVNPPRFPSILEGSWDLVSRL